VGLLASPHAMGCASSAEADTSRPQQRLPSLPSRQYDPNISSLAMQVAQTRSRDKYDPRERMWKNFNGAGLEALLTVDPELGESPVALVDARFLIALAQSGGRLVRRQDLPPEAFISLVELRKMRTIGSVGLGGGGGGGGLRVMCIS
jgi:hypothetical protein